MPVVAEKPKNFPLVVIIPTRNRLPLAQSAIGSVLEQPETSDVQILVSDNSTALESSIQLERFCLKLANRRLHYIKPPQSMSMTEHWNWAINQALDSYDSDHFVYLADRALFKPGSLADLKAIIKCCPDMVISYNYDGVLDHRSPILVAQQGWSGKLFNINSSRLLHLSSQCFFHQSLPRMLNSVAPRFILEKIRKAFGNIFGSISPDYCFAYRCLTSVPSILYYDRAPIIGYGFALSNGIAFSRGIMSEARKDFEGNLPNGKTGTYLAPIPEVNIGWNAVVHEYMFVKKETGSPYFPEIQMEKYVPFLAEKIAKVEDRDLKAQMFGVLRDYGWKENRLLRIFSKRGNMNWSNILRSFWNRVVKPMPRFFTLDEAIQYALKDSDPNRKPQYLKDLEKYLGPIVVTPSGGTPRNP